MGKCIGLVINEASISTGAPDDDDASGCGGSCAKATAEGEKNKDVATAFSDGADFSEVMQAFSLECEADSV